MEINAKLKQKLEAEGYKHLTYIEGKGICGIKAFLFTIGLCCGLEEYSYDHRYCYPPESAMIPILQLVSWKQSGEEITGDPEDEYWIKKKGSEEYSNHRNSQFDERFDKKAVSNF